MNARRTRRVRRRRRSLRTCARSAAAREYKSSGAPQTRPSSTYVATRADTCRRPAPR